MVFEGDSLKGYRIDVKNDKVVKIDLPNVEERKVGKWVRKLIRNDKGGCIGAEMICSCCNKDNRHDEYMDYCPNCGAEMRGNEMDKQQAKHILKNTGYIGNEVGVAFDVAIKSMDKLEKIEQIVNNYDGSMYSMKQQFNEIQKVLEKE